MTKRISFLLPSICIWKTRPRSSCYTDIAFRPPPPPLPLSLVIYRIHTSHTYPLQTLLSLLHLIRIRCQAKNKKGKKRKKNKSILSIKEIFGKSNLCGIDCDVNEMVKRSLFGRNRKRYTVQSSTWTLLSSAPDQMRWKKKNFFRVFLLFFCQRQMRVAKKKRKKGEEEEKGR